MSSPTFFIMQKCYLLLVSLLLTVLAPTAYGQCPTPIVTADGPTSFCDPSGSVSLMTDPGSLRYASSVVAFSSQYHTSGTWAAVEALGAPNTYPDYGDIGSAWASLSPDGQREYLVLGFANPAPAARILIWETLAPGAVDTVWVRNPNTNLWENVYTATAAPITPANSRILNINFPATTAFNVQYVRIALNSPAVSGWNEIDAVALSNTRASYQWTRNNVDLAGATGPGLSNITAGGSYAVRVTNATNCTATSATTTVVPGYVPTVSVNPPAPSTCGATPVALTASVPGQSGAGNALHFANGSSQYGTVPDSPSLDLTNSFTIECWLNASGSGSVTQNVLCKSSLPQNNGYIFPRTDDTWGHLEIYLNAGGWTVFNVPYTAYIGTWHHLAATYDGSMVRFYIDGTQVQQFPFSGTLTTNSNPLTIGSQPGYGEYFVGGVDEARVWNVARSAAQIAADYNKTVAPTSPGLVAYFPFNEGSGASANDVSLSNNDATLINGPVFQASGASVNEGFTYTWSPATGLSATTGPNVTASPTNTTTYTVTATANSTGCSGNQTVTVTINNGLTWNGSVSTDWFNAANWSCGTVPTATSDVTIPAGATFYPIVNSGTAVARNLTINSLGALHVPTGGTLDVKGQFVNQGVFDNSGTGMVMFSGSSAQQIGGGYNSFENLTIGPAGATLNTAASVHRMLTLNGNLSTNGQALVLESDASGTAMVVNNGGVVVGNATVERYIDPSLNSGSGYRHYSSPVAAAPLNDLNTGTFTATVNPLYNTSATPQNVTPFPNVFGYDETRLASSPATGGTAFDKGWISPTSASSTMQPMQGYTVHIPASSTVDLTGTLNNGSMSATGLSRGTDPNAGWHLLGNPYPAPLDFTLLGRSGIDAAVYMFQSSGPYAGSYQGFVNGVSFNGGTAIVPVMKGFFVRTSTPGVNGTLTYSNAARLTNYANPTFRRDARPRITLELQASNGQADQAVAYFEQGATAGFDAAFDAHKLSPGGSPVLALLAGTQPLAVNGLPALSGTDVTLPVLAQLPQAGSCTLRTAELANLPVGYRAYLRDALTGTTTDLSLQPTYSFVASPAAPGRFTLVITQSRLLATMPFQLSEQVSLYPNPAQREVQLALPTALSQQAVRLSFLNALGQVALQRTLPAGTSAHTLTLNGLAAGVYSVQLQTSLGLVTKRLVVE